MFFKTFKIKSNNQLKTSDRKQLKDDFKRAFSNLSDSDLNDIFPKKDVISLVKVEVQGGVIINAYLVAKIPIAFLHAGTLFPTVFLLWRYPNMILSFTTHAPVISKLEAGADLMLPGVIDPFSKSTNFLGKAPAFVNISTNMAAFAVGITAASYKEMLASQNRGKCLVIYHVYGDKLCTIDSPTYSLVPELGSPEVAKRDIEEVNEEVVDDNACDNNEEVEGVEEATTSSDRTASEYSELLVHCFFSCLRQDKVSLPILASTFYKSYLLPKCPVDKPLDIKKTTYKKFGSFLETMKELGMVKLDESKKGVINITEFNYEHQCVVEFVYDSAYTRIKTEKEQVADSQTNVIESHSVTAIVAPIFMEFGYGKGSPIENANIRQLVVEYVNKHQLQNLQDKKYVNLNPTLRSICLGQMTATYPYLIDKIYQVMTPCYKITCGGKEVIRRGKLETVNISVAKRSGNKKVTLVDNVEVYGINIEELSSYCQRGVAASTTINRSQTPKKTDQLQIQGNQVLFVHNLLVEKYKLPKRYIRGLEFAPKKKN